MISSICLPPTPPPSLTSSTIAGATPVSSSGCVATPNAAPGSPVGTTSPSLMVEAAGGADDPSLSGGAGPPGGVDEPPGVAPVAEPALEVSAPEPGVPPP